jgi:hypothetical protein
VARKLLQNKGLTGSNEAQDIANILNQMAETKLGMVMMFDSIDEWKDLHHFTIYKKLFVFDQGNFAFDIISLLFLVDVGIFGTKCVSPRKYL